MSRPEQLETEAIHPLARQLNHASTAVYLDAMLADFDRVPAALRVALPDIVILTERVAAALGSGGRLILGGAGTSGRLAALEAAECPPTFGTDPAQIVALIAGGPAALAHAVEGAEDDAAAGASDIRALEISPADVVVGISASGQTPYVRGLVAEARQRRACTAVIVCNAGSLLAQDAELAIVLPTGAELVAGSTRLKAAAAQKLALNLVTTSALRKLGHVRAGRMVALRATNAKLRRRAIGIVSDLAGIEESAAEALLERANGDVSRALRLADGALREPAPQPSSPELDVDLRRLGPGDASAMAALAAEPSIVASTAPFVDLGGEALFQAWLTRPGLMLGAWVGVQLVGVVLVERRAALLREHVADITYVAVAPVARGSGVGDRLIAAVLAWARREGLTRVELRVWPDNLTAIRLYERHGFAIEGRLRQHARVQGRYVDAFAMAWLAPDDRSGE